MLRFAILFFAVSCFLSGSLYSLSTWKHSSTSPFGVLKISGQPSKTFISQCKRVSVGWRASVDTARGNNRSSIKAL